MMRNSDLFSKTAYYISEKEERAWPDDFLNHIICGDCLEIMPQIPDSAIDLIVTSPPYFLQKSYEKEWTEEKYDALLAGVFLNARRILKPGGYFVIQEMYSDGDQTPAQQVDKLVHHLEVKVDSLSGISHFETFTRQRLRDLFNHLGLSEIEVFESSWSVKCLYCDDAQDCANPTRADYVEFVLKQIDEVLTRVNEHSSYYEIREEAESLKERVKAHGSSAASVMYIFGKKS